VNVSSDCVCESAHVARPRIGSHRPERDETCVQALKGRRFVRGVAWQKMNPYPEVIAFLKSFGNDLGSIFVDSNGVGLGLLLHLRAQGFAVTGVNWAGPRSSTRATRSASSTRRPRCTGGSPTPTAKAH
jgi:hypothetical protein